MKTEKKPPSPADKYSLKYNKMQQSVHSADILEIMFILEIFLSSKMPKTKHSIFVLVNLHLWVSVMLIFWLSLVSQLLTWLTLMVDVCQLGDDHTST